MGGGADPMITLGRQQASPARSLRSVASVRSVASLPSRQVSVAAATFSLVSTIVGGGNLSLPFAFSRCGIVGGSLTLLVAAMASAFTVDLLVTCAMRRGSTTYEEVGAAAFGRAAKTLTAVLVFVLCWMVCLGYLVIAADLLLPVVYTVTGISIARHWVLLAVAIIELPFCAQDSLHALRFISVLSVAAMAVLTASLAYRSISFLTEDSPFDAAGAAGHKVYVHDGKSPDDTTCVIVEDSLRSMLPLSFSDFVYTFPLFGVAFGCHTNVLPVHMELTDPTRYRFRKVVFGTMGICTLFYIFIGVCGSMYARELTCGNILLNFDSADPFITVGRACLALTVVLSYPLLALPCRTSARRLITMAFGIDTDGPAGLGDLSSGNTNGADVDDSVTALRLAAANPKDYRTLSHVTPPRRVRRADERPSPSRLTLSPSPSDPVSPMRVGARRGGRDDDTESMFSQESTSNTSMSSATRRLSFLYSAIEGALVVGTTVFAALLTPGVVVVWTLMGSTVALAVVYFLPCVYYLKLKYREAWGLRKMLALFIATMSAFMAVACTYEAIIHVRDPACPTPNVNKGGGDNTVYLSCPAVGGTS